MSKVESYEQNFAVRKVAERKAENYKLLAELCGEKITERKAENYKLLAELCG